jgi:hypothetical protein
MTSFTWKRGGSGSSGGGGGPLPTAFYAAPTAAGLADGSSPANAALIGNLWAPMTAPAKTGGGVVCYLLDGTYTGASSMINVPAGFSGTLASPFLMTALNDGAVLIDGQTTNNPVSLTDTNQYLHFQGFNAAHAAVGSVGVVSVRGDFNQFRRICAWDAALNYNKHVFEVTGPGTTYALFEDCAGFGVSRKIFSPSQGGINAVFRRCWGRWQGNTNTGPKDTGLGLYNSDLTTIENCVWTWTGESLPTTYTIQNNGVDFVCQTSVTAVNLAGTGSKSWTLAGSFVSLAVGMRVRMQDHANSANFNTGAVTAWDGVSALTVNVDTVSGSGTPANVDVYCIMVSSMIDQPWALQECGNNEVGRCAVYGTIMYFNKANVPVKRPDGAILSGFGCLFANKENNVTVRDNCAIATDIVTDKPRPFYLADSGGNIGGGAGVGLTATNMSGFHGTAGGSASQIAPAWSPTNVIESTTPAAFYTGTGPDGVNPESLWNTSRGAQIRYRYINGVLGTTLLWPFPMSARIKAATTASGYSIADVDAELQAMFGTYPTF